MKSHFVYVLSIALSAVLIPAVAAVNIPIEDSGTASSLVDFEHHWYRAATSQIEETYKPIALDENTFTQFKVLDSETNEVFDISARDYVVGAVCAEMPASFEKEALKAQAVAIYTYAVRKTLDEMENPTPALCGANISNDPNVHLAYYDEAKLRELYGENYEEYYQKVCNAVDEVFGQVLIYDGEPIVAAFHSMSSGRTESAENIWGKKTDYLVSVESAGDTLCADYVTQTVISAEDMRLLLAANIEGVDLSSDCSEWIKIISSSDSKTVLQVQVGGVAVTGTQLRSILGLRSAAFELSYSQESGFVFTCYGFGHGVGMSQYGANEMAKNSYSYSEILFHYYQNTKIAEIEIVF